MVWRWEVTSDKHYKIKYFSPESQNLSTIFWQINTLYFAQTVNLRSQIPDMYKILFITLAFFSIAACNNPDTNGGTTGTEAVNEPPRIGFSIVNTYAHDTSFFTEGLEFYNGQLFESSGSGTAGDEKPAYPSAFGILNLKTGKVDRKVELNNHDYFGEGITFFDGKIYQLTWKNNIGFVYDANTFKKLHEFHYTGEGWALTHDSSRLIMSTGGSNLLFIDPKTLGDTLKVQSLVGVTDNNGPVSNINELEFIDGYVFSNQWGTNYILKIDPNSGKVVGKLDLSPLAEEASKKFANSKEMNGIAYHPDTKTIYVTGKCWPTVYEIKLN